MTVPNMLIRLITINTLVAVLPPPPPPTPTLFDGAKSQSVESVDESAA